MYRYGLAIALAAACALPQAARAQAAQQELVDRATLAAQDMLNDKDGTDAQALLRRARAAMICPQVFRAGFVFGGQGGTCVLVARDGNGSWSSPAFYSMGSGSFGLQAGLQDSEVMMMILTERGLRAVMDDQFKIGGDAGATFIQWGGGIEGATTAAVGADIVGFTRSRGLYAGVSLSGSLLTTKSAWNRAYYGREEAAQQIVISMDASNPGAAPLREVLAHVGSSVTASASSAQPIAVASAAPAGQIDSAPLPPPSRAGSGYAGYAPVQRAPLPQPPTLPRRY